MTEARSTRSSPAGGADPDALERELSEAVLAGAGRVEVLAAVRRATGRHARLLAAEGSPLASTDGGAGVAPRVAGTVLAGAAGARVETLDGAAGWALPVRAGATVGGVLLVLGPAEPGIQRQAAAAVTPLLIDAVRGAAGAPPAPRHTPADVIAALRSGAVSPSVHAAAAGLGLDLRRPPAGAVLYYRGARLRAWSTALTWLTDPVQQEGRLAWTVVADDAALADLQDRLRLTVESGSPAGDEGVVAACGSRPASAAALAESFAEADRLLALARARGLPTLTFDRCGVVQLLVSLPRGRLESFVEAHLGPVRHRPELLATLRAWLAASGSRQRVSEQLHLHRNSVGYRVRQLKNLLGVDPLAPQTSAELHLALAALDLLAADELADRFAGGDAPSARE